MKLFVYGTLQKKLQKQSMLELLDSTYISEAQTDLKYPMYINDINVPVLCNLEGYGYNIKGELWEVNNIYEICELESSYFLSQISVNNEDVYVFMKSCPYLKNKNLINKYEKYEPFKITKKDLKEYSKNMTFSEFNRNKHLYEYYTLDENNLKNYSSLKSLNFNVGAEFEFYLNNISDVDAIMNELKVIHNSPVRVDLSGKETKNISGENWFICRDFSLDSSKEGIEISTPKVKFKELYKIIAQMSKLIKKYGTVDNHCSLHIHSSSELLTKKINITKFIILCKLDGVLDWDVRSHANDIYKVLLMTKIEQLNYLDELLTRRYQLNFIEDNHIEYRAIGGDYINQLEKIKQNFINFLSNIKYCTNDTDRQDEYNKIMNDEVIPFMDKKHLVNLNVLVDLSKINLDDKNKKFLI